MDVLVSAYPPKGCMARGCPGHAVYRGYCAVHQQTTTQRGYGQVHQVERASALPGARCSECGCTSSLQRDHRVPVSLGGSQASSNKRWLCRCPQHRCHDRVGVRRDRQGQRYTSNFGSDTPRLTHAVSRTPQKTLSLPPERPVHVSVRSAHSRATAVPRNAPVVNAAKR